MAHLTAADLYSLEEYARIRSDFRKRVIEHKKHRRVAIGPNAALYFEDSLTMQYQVQEMLRIERIFEPEGIQEELDVYNPLIPDGSNWKATFMVEFADEAERKEALSRLLGIDRAVWIQVEGFDKVRPVSNEDLDRETEDKTSSVHFMRFELTQEMVAALKQDAGLAMGIDHPAYDYTISEVDGAVRKSLLEDLA